MMLLFQALFGAPLPNPLVPQVQQAAAAGDWMSLGAHVAASGLVGPVWEEVSSEVSSLVDQVYEVGGTARHHIHNIPSAICWCCNQIGMHVL